MSSIKLFPKSDNDQFVYTSDAETYYEDPKKIPNCQVSNRLVAYHEWDPEFTEFACHGNILRFYVVDGLFATVEELLD